MAAGPWTDALVVDASDTDRSAYELGADEARAWDEISQEVGRRLLPVLERLAAALPSTTGVMVATADGFSLCALGLAGDRVERVSAMTSALFSMAPSATTGDDGVHDGAELLTITSEHTSTVVVAIAGLSLGAAVLWVTGRDSLGAMIHRSRAAVETIAALGI